MITQSFLGALPGGRIDDYRNSTPRFVKVLGVGESARAIVDHINATHAENVLTTGQLDPNELLPIDEPVEGVKPNAVIVVYQRGEAAPFPFLIERTAAMLSFIVLETNGKPSKCPEAPGNRKIREISGDR